MSEFRTDEMARALEDVLREGHEKTDAIVREALEKAEVLVSDAIE